MVSTLVHRVPLCKGYEFEAGEVAASRRARPRRASVAQETLSRSVEIQVGRVLVVDPEIATRFTLRRLFEARGWLVTLAKGLGEGEASINSTLDWIVIDPDLPDGEGEDLLALVRTARHPARIAILSRDFAAHPRLSEFAPDLLMEKPVAFDRLFAECAGIL